MWKMVKLGDVFVVRRGTTITKNQTTVGNVPVIGGGTKPTYYHSEANREANCITISGSGASAGFVNMWNVPIFASDCSTVEPKDSEHLQQFVFYYLLYQQQFIYENFRSGAAQPHVYAKDIETLPYPLLPVTEQKRIVAKLDAAFAEIDEAVVLTAARGTEVEKLKVTLLSSMLMSDEWSTAKIGSVCELAYGKALPANERLNKSEFPAYGANGVKTYATSALFSKASIIIGRKGSAGQINKVSLPFWALDVTYYVKVNEEKVDLDYIFYVLTNLQLPRLARGVKPGINRNDVYEQVFFLPPLPEQKSIVFKLDSAFKEIETVNLSIIKSQKNYQALKTAILTLALQPPQQ